MIQKCYNHFATQKRRSLKVSTGKWAETLILQHNCLSSNSEIFETKPVEYKFSIVVLIFQLLSHVWLFVTPWTAACQASLFFTIFQSLVKLTSIVLMLPPNDLILCRSLLLPSIFPIIRVFSNELVFYCLQFKAASWILLPEQEATSTGAAQRQGGNSFSTFSFSPSFSFHLLPSLHSVPLLSSFLPSLPILP